MRKKYKKKKNKHVCYLCGQAIENEREMMKLNKLGENDYLGEECHIYCVFPM